MQGKEPTIEQVRGALVRIATLYLDMPYWDVKKHLGEEKYAELCQCYDTARALVPRDPTKFGGRRA